MVDECALLRTCGGMKRVRIACHVSGLALKTLDFSSTGLEIGSV